MGTGIKGSDRAGNLEPVIPAPSGQKAVQGLQPCCPRAGLAIGARIEGQTKVACGRHCYGPGPLWPGQAGWRRSLRQGHVGIPSPGPAITGSEPPDDAGLPQFVPNHTGLLCPGGNAFITGVGPAIAGFLMAPQRGNPVLLLQGSKDFYHIARENSQRLTLIAQVSLQLGEAFSCTCPLSGIGVRPRLKKGFCHIDGQDWPRSGRTGQGRVILNAQIAPEPDDIQHVFVLLRSATHRGNARRSNAKGPPVGGPVWLVRKLAITSP